MERLEKSGRFFYHIKSKKKNTNFTNYHELFFRVINFTNVLIVQICANS
jgi:hypothetical protein